MYHGEGKRAKMETYLTSVGVKAGALLVANVVVFNVALTIMGAIAGIDKLVTAMAGADTYE
jgi:hypothetical protein